MKSNSHRTLGQYLLETYMVDYPQLFCKAFSFGCVQPDKNPTTFLKGSIKWKWFRGHNWDNAENYICKVGDRLQNRKKLGVLGYYQLGKLIHYTADAFTYAHNNHYNESLSAHRDYEKKLHNYLEQYLNISTVDYDISFDPECSVSDFICTNHKRYMHHLPCMENDLNYCVRMCAQVLQLQLQSKSFVSI